jgi:hypothetical protein
MRKFLALFLIAALVAAGVSVGLPGKADAVAKKTYNVLILNPATSWDRLNATQNNESPAISLGSVNNAAPETVIDANEGITFQMVIYANDKTDKKTGATYYDVTIPGNSFKVPIARYDTTMGIVKTTNKMVGNAKGKIYISGGDVDVSQVMAEGKLNTKIGDGTLDPDGSLVLAMTTVITCVIEATGKPFLKQKSTTTWTTGKSSLLVKGSKSGLEGKAMPDDDPTGLLTKPLVGEPLNLDAGTGKLVSSSVAMNLKSPVGLIDYLRGDIWVMFLTPVGSKSAAPGGNPGYASVIVGPSTVGPSQGSLALYSIEISSATALLSSGSGTTLTVVVTSLTNVAITGNLTVTAYIYTSTVSGPITQWVEAAGSPQTIVTFANITVDPERTVSFLVPLFAPAIAQPMLIVVKADFILAP